MEIVPDPVAAVVLTLPFAFTATFLWLVLFRPMVAYLEERRAVSANALAEAAHLNEGAARRTAEIEQRLSGARETAGVARRDARARAQKREAAILAEARAESDKKVAAALAALTTDRAVASAVLKGQAGELGREMSRQILGREV